LRVIFIRVACCFLVGGEEGGGFFVGVIAALGLEVAEFAKGAMHHSLEALFGGQEAFEGGVGAAAVLARVVNGGAEGAGDEEAGAERLWWEIGLGEGLFGVVEVVGVSFVELAEVLVLVFDGAAEVGFFHDGEEMVGGLEAAEAPGGADDAFGEAEFDGVHGAEALEDGLAVGVEEGFGFAGLEEVGGVGVVGGGVLGDGAFSLGGTGAGGVLGVEAVGGCALGGAGG
jgi:hypothetical protein